MKKIYYVSYCDKFEGEGMFDAKGNLLDAWSRNDGDWRGEYFDGFMKKLGIEVDYSRSDDQNLVKKLLKVLDPYGD
ncbi:MAG TPA: hypothetical protein VEP90_09870 [Methylomirabilota bacterium]|nr:hypothetical protein [Methylomirabilota bacterium]